MKKAFTLVELLIVAFILFVLGTLLYSVVEHVSTGETSAPKHVEKYYH